MSSTPETLRAEIERLRAMCDELAGAVEGMNAHWAAMQDMCTRYLIPETYVGREGNNAPGDNFAREHRNALYINDVIWMLDGPEQREVEGRARTAYAKYQQEQGR